MVAVLVTVAVALLANRRGGWLVVWGFAGIAQWVIANAARLQGLYMHAADLLEQRGLYAAELFAEQVNVLWLVQVLRAIGGSLQGVLSFSIVIFVFGILGLLEVEPLGRRLCRMGEGQRGGATIEAAMEIAARLQTYMLVQFAIGSYIEPRVAGTAVSVSPFMVLFAVFFWGVVWGIAGAFIGVPILIAFATVRARHAPARPIAVLLSAGLAKGEKS